MQRLKVALVGLGSVAQRGILPHLACADAQEHIETVACVDPIPGRATATAERFGWHEAYDSYDEMLAHADVEAVLLATPIPLHFPQAKQALLAGKHVYVQKTMTMTSAEATELIELAAQQHRYLIASPGQMLRPVYRLAHDLLKAGVLGRIYWAFTATSGLGHETEQFRQGADVLTNVDPTWYYQKGGGPMYDMAVYSLHLITGLLGEAKRVTALSGIGLPERAWKDKTIPVEMDDNTIALLDFNDNTFATVGGHNSVAPPGVGFSQVWISGTTGSMQLSTQKMTLVLREHHPSVSLLENQEGITVHWISPAPNRGEVTVEVNQPLPHVSDIHTQIPEHHVYADIMHFVDVITRKVTPVATPEHARHVIDIIESAYRSAQTDQVQQLTTTFTWSPTPTYYQQGAHA
jgi:predicted dehydrogenase